MEWTVLDGPFIKDLQTRAWWLYCLEFKLWKTKVPKPMTLVQGSLWRSSPQGPCVTLNLSSFLNALSKMNFKSQKIKGGEKDRLLSCYYYHAPSNRIVRNNYFMSNKLKRTWPNFEPGLTPNFYGPKTWFARIDRYGSLQKVTESNESILDFVVHGAVTLPASIPTQPQAYL